MPMTWSHSFYHVKGSQRYSHSRNILKKQTSSICYK